MSTSIQKMLPITVRLSQQEMSFIDQTSKTYGLSKAEVIRAAVSQTKLKISKHICVNITEQQYTEIKSLCYEILTELNRIKTELHRIGINYNQAVKQLNTANMSMYEIAKLQVEQKQKGTGGLNKDELQGLMDQLTAAAKKAGEGICHILE